MKLSSILASVLLLGSMTLTSANDLDPTRGLNIKKPTLDDKPTSKESTKAKKIDFYIVSSLPTKGRNFQAVQTFFNKNSKTLYMHLLDQKGSNLLAATVKKWKKGVRPIITQGQIYTNTQFFKYEPKNNEILGISYQVAKGAKKGRQYVTYYDASNNVKYKSNVTTWEMNPKAVVYDIQTCNGGAIVNFSGNPHAINRTSNMSMPMGSGKNKLIVNDFKFNNTCTKIIFPEYHNKQPYLAFVDYPMPKSDPKKLKVLNKNEIIFRIAAERNGKYYAVSAGNHIEVYNKSGKKIIDKKLASVKCSMKDKIFNVKFSPNSKYLGLTQTCGKFSLIDIQSGSIINETRTNPGLFDLDFAPDGSALVLNAGTKRGFEVSVLTANPEGSPFF